MSIYELATPPSTLIRSHHNTRFNKSENIVNSEFANDNNYNFI